MGNKILITGAAGFIGYHVFKRLRNDGFDVWGIDSLNNYYDVNLKFGRLRDLGFEMESIADGREVESRDGGHFIQMHIEDRSAVQTLFLRHSFDSICHLAAQAGVRYSLENPHAYIDSNVVGFLNLLEAARNHPVGHFVFASSSSVYGANAKIPFSTDDSVDLPISLYAATKKCDELMAHCYSYLFKIPLTGLRFFTVYGPWGRPDMALFKFTKSILADTPIPVFNRGDMKRDFTYVDDIVEGVVRVLRKPPAPGEVSGANYAIYNIGNGKPVPLLDFIRAIEEAVGKTARLELLPLQPGDVHATWADTEKLTAAIGDWPRTDLRDGVRAFVSWYRGFYRV